MTLGKFVTGASVAVALAGAGLFAVRTFASPEVDGVRKSCEAVKSAFNSHDGKAFAAVFTEDADMVDPMGKLVTGRAEIEKAMTGMLGPTGPLREATVVVNDEPFRLISPDVAITDADATITGSYAPDGKKAGPMNVVFTNVWKKTGDTWKVAACRARVKASPPAEAPTK